MVNAWQWDVSSWDHTRGPVDMVAAKADGINAVIVKITEGDFYVNPYAQQDLINARAAGFPLIGVYHALHGAISVPAQVNWFLSHIKSLAPWLLTFPGRYTMADAERWTGDTPPTEAQTEQFCDLYAQDTGDGLQRQIVYGPRWCYGNTLTGLAHRLVASSYGADSAEHYQAGYAAQGGDASTGWTAYSGQVPLLLQFGSTLTVGSQPTCDVSAYRGTPDQLYAALTGSAPSTTVEYPDMTGMTQSDFNALMKGWFDSQTDYWQWASMRDSPLYATASLNQGSYGDLMQALRAFVGFDPANTNKPSFGTVKDLVDALGALKTQVDAAVTTLKTLAAAPGATSGQVQVSGTLTVAPPSQ